MFIRKSKVNDYYEEKYRKNIESVEKEFKKKLAREKRSFENELDELERGHISERKQIIKEFKEEIKRHRKEKWNTLNDARRFYETWRDVPVRVMEIWRDIDTLKNMQLNDKAKQVSISKAINQNLDSLERFMQSNDEKVDKLIGLEEHDEKS